jgi:membrane protease subunit HflC
MSAYQRFITGIIVIAVIVVAALLMASTYALDEAEQAVVLQFGKPVGDPVTTPGLHFKVPFIQEVRRFDKRLLIWDGDPNQIPTSGREFISVDTTARWRIVDPRKFLESVTNEQGAQSRLDDVIDSSVRDKISATELTDIVRSADWSVTQEDLQREEVVAAESGDKELQQPVKVGRQTLTRQILESAQAEMRQQYGIELLDVRIKRLNYIQDVRRQVYDRMISERQRIAEKYRSEGQGEASRIEGETSRQLAEIRSQARREAEVIRGEADAEATRIYAEAYSADPEFYAFQRTLESYAKSLEGGTTLLLSPEGAYFRYLRSIEAGGGEVAE